MINYKIIFGAIATISILGCEISTKKLTKNELTGHWHCARTSDCYFETLDIGDSSTVTNKYELGGQLIEYRRKNKRGLEILPFQDYTTTETFTLNGDTLEVSDSTSTYKYVKSNLRDCLINDRYTSSTIEIGLKEVDAADNYEISYKVFCSEDLFIGKLKKGNNYFDSLTNKYPDSIFIETRSVWIKLSDIPLLCRELNICFESKPTNINLHADNDVAPEFLRRIEKLIPDSIEIHKVVKTNSRDIGLQKIN